MDRSARGVDTPVRWEGARIVIGSIVALSLRYRLIVLGAAASLIIFGYTQLPRVPVDVLPEFSPPIVEVQTEALGLSAEEVEQLITVPLEADLLHGVAWLDEIRSQSMPGLSSIVLTFQAGTDPIRARQMVAERLTQAHALPNVSKPPVMIQPLSSLSRVMMVGLSSRDTSLIDMSVLARWTVKPRLLGVPGVANVSIWGQRERQLQVLVDPERLRARHVTLQDVIESSGNALWSSPLTFIEASTPGTGGFIDTPNQRMGIQHILPIRTPEDMAKIPIEGKAGISIGEVSTIVLDHQPLIGDAVVGDAPGLFLVIEKFPEANTLEVSRGVQQAMDALRPGLAGIEIDTSVFRPASFIEASTGNMLIAFTIGLVLLALVLGLLLNWRAAAVTLITVPLALAAASFVVYLAGGTINAMLLAGLALAIGVVVDDVVVGTDSVIRRFRERRAEDADRPTRVILLEAIAAGRSPIAAATVIVVLGLLPTAFVAGSVGAFMPELVRAYLLAIVASLVVALSVAPALTSLLILGRPGQRREVALIARLKARYRAALLRVTRRAGMAVAAAGIASVLVLVLAAAARPQAGPAALPQFQERDLLVRLSGLPATSRVEMDRVVARMTAELRTAPGVRDVGAHVGRAITSDRVVNTNAADVWVSMENGADYAATRATIEEIVQGYPGLERSVTTYTRDRVDGILSTDANDFSVRIYGQDQVVLDAKAQEIRQALAGISGVSDAAVEEVPREPTIQIQVDLAAAERVGLKPGDIRRATTSLVSGIEVGALFEEQKVFEVVVWGGAEFRNSVNAIGELLIDTPSGTPVRLADVASVRIASTPTVVRREGVMRTIDITGRVSGRDFGAVMKDVDAAIGSVAFPLEFHAEVTQIAAERQAELVRLLIAMLVAAVGIYLVLQASFGSWRLASLVFITLPAALIGGLLVGVALGGGSLTLGTIVALFAVMAIAVRNGIGLIATYRQLEAANGHARVDLIVQGAIERLGPIVTTAIGTAVAIAPFVLLGDFPGFEVVRPMAAAIIGGLVTSTLVCLFVLPAVYLRSGPSPEAETEASAHVEQPALSPA
jgi:Cu/Ag efflux pump CusA